MSESPKNWKKSLDKALQDEYDRCSAGLSFRFETVRQVFREELANQKRENLEEAARIAEGGMIQVEPEPFIKEGYGIILANIVSTRNKVAQAIRNLANKEDKNEKI